MYKLCYILKFVIDGFYDRSFLNFITFLRYLMAQKSDEVKK